MIRIQRNAVVCLLLIGSLLVLCGGCGGSNNGASAGEAVISSAQVTAASTQLAKVLAVGVSATNAESCSNAFKNLYFCTAPLASTATCTGGGTAAITGSVSDSWEYYATGIGVGTLTFNPVSCAIPGTSMVMTGNPGLTGNASISFFYATPTSLTTTETGSFKYGPSPAGACSATLSVTANYSGTTSCTFTGTVCGQAVSGSCE
jgi:hypothetical protein